MRPEKITLPADFRELTTAELTKGDQILPFQECSFGDDGCDFCERECVETFYVRTCYEVEEGDYYCRLCASKYVIEETAWLAKMKDTDWEAMLHHEQTSQPDSIT